MKKKILSQLMILSFAFAGLFLVGNNLYGGTGEIRDDHIPPAITCGENEGLCWKESNNVTICLWDGRMRFSCWGGS